MGHNEEPDTPQQESEEKKLGSLDMVEKVVNEYAKTIAARHRIQEDAFSVILSTEFSRGIMGVRRGPVAQIILLWPDAQPNINTLLNDAFRLIAKTRLVDSFAVESAIVIRRRNEERRKWIREKLGSDEADIILDLIPKHRVRTRVTTTVEYEDVITKEKISVTHSARPEQYRGQDVGMWLRLSRQVRNNHPEEATRYADPIIIEQVAELATGEELQAALLAIELVDRGVGTVPEFVADRLDSES